MQTTDSKQHTFYRDRISASGLVSFSVIMGETDLLIFADRPLAVEAERSVMFHRNQLKKHISNFPDFENSLEPLPPCPSAPPLIAEMLEAGCTARVGPMAAVAGAIAERVGNDLLLQVQQVIVENGGDIFLAVSKDLTVGIYAGSSPLSNRLAIRIPSELTPLGVCTSSGTVGHSLSFGKSDAVTVLSRSTALADAAATAVGNVVNGTADIGRGIDLSRTIPGILGTIIIVDDRFGAWGAIEIVPTQKD